MWFSAKYVIVEIKFGIIFYAQPIKLADIVISTFCFTSFYNLLKYF